ncbi:uncharacterized protein BYT42DRAFT_571326 [Radiomyces spectabilis]|uniref:uncharacterized protein n=1 Tax=Radiomyces spectabilis TaxID=64574 RepID=UPI002220215B|nr:uncharacterized protein BYT42DRAFT_571326 [Radiomyces spectabilis]KAI8377710.1 hypothetical protein BYT42DRAFT_571326 [Radiomyces spectabilis]
MATLTDCLHSLFWMGALVLHEVFLFGYVWEHLRTPTQTINLEEFYANKVPKITYENLRDLNRGEAYFFLWNLSESI